MDVEGNEANDSGEDGEGTKSEGDPDTNGGLQNTPDQEDNGKGVH